MRARRPPPPAAARPRSHALTSRLPARSGPTTVLVSSLVFIGCVVILHIWGKFRGTQ